MLMVFVRVFWSVLWRSFTVLLLNVIINYAITYLAHPLYEWNTFLIKLRMSLSLLPETIIFLILAVKIKEDSKILFESLSPISIESWKNIYIVFFILYLSIMILIGTAAVLTETVTWLFLKTYLPLGVFFLFWIIISVWQTPSAYRRIRVHSEKCETGFGQDAR